MLIPRGVKMHEVNELVVFAVEMGMGNTRHTSGCWGGKLLHDGGVNDIGLNLPLVLNGYPVW